MDGLERSKERLKKSLVQLENTINSKFAKYEIDNLALKEQLVKYKQQKTTTTLKKPANEEFQNEDSLEGYEQLVTTATVGAIDLSLQELKKLVG